MTKQPVSKRCPYKEDCGMIPAEIFQDHTRTHATQIDLLTGEVRGMPVGKIKRRRVANWDSR